MVDVPGAFPISSPWSSATRPIGTILPSPFVPVPVIYVLWPLAVTCAMRVRNATSTAQMADSPSGFPGPTYPLPPIVTGKQLVLQPKLDFGNQNVFVEGPLYVDVIVPSGEKACKPIGCSLPDPTSSGAACSMSAGLTLLATSRARASIGRRIPPRAHVAVHGVSAPMRRTYGCGPFTPGKAFPCGVVAPAP